jgi:Xaa-Pro aminopeptidase
MAPPPPPPPLCFPSFGKKGGKKTKPSPLSRELTDKSHRSERMERKDSKSPTATLTDADINEKHFDALTFADSTAYTEVLNQATLQRSDTKRSGKSGFGYGFGLGKTRAAPFTPITEEEDRPFGPSRTNSKSSKKSNDTYESRRSGESRQTTDSRPGVHSRTSSQSKRPHLFGRMTNNSSDTLVGSAFERKINDFEEPKQTHDTSPRLEELRQLMAKENLDY